MQYAMQSYYNAFRFYRSSVINILIVISTIFGCPPTKSSNLARALGRRRTWRRPAFVSKFDFFDPKNKTLDTIMAIRNDQIRKTLALIPLVAIRIRPPARQRKNNRMKTGRRSIRKIHKQTTTFIGYLKGLPRWHLCLAPTGITRIRLFSVDCGDYRQSGP
ncbi:hypothetical protein F511_33696 [Dorcoceras hygrometricum]|uniref:Uncharacterized protein n=1 Tax=Dorcoceras hygrometricum TaxID=472368 RepID=A0A2Z7BGQ0_9LAMI|nr:hypothetical protein F511_33696 [Dorcoceras hygrometricum]